MNIIGCQHKRKLKWPECHETFMPEAVDPLNPEKTTVITFARCNARVRNLSSTDRFCQPITGDVLFSYWDYTPLAAHLLWDVAHILSPGACIYLQVSDFVAELLGREYYRAFFMEEASTSLGLRVFRKIGPLPVEQDRGLTGWSFCIPTGGGNARQLNICVERIISLNIPASEILLCGKPSVDFLYLQHVTVLDDEFSGSPVHITGKKNRLAEVARYPNLCILHDRVLLPHNFATAVERFGDHFPFTGFQSFWFADTWRAVPRRYSDFCLAQFVPAVIRDKHRPKRSDLAEFERMRFAAQHPARADFGKEYLTGSLYLCKRSLWRLLPQNEALYWGEYEDVEQGIQAAMAGVPSRINPFAFTETLSYRSIFHHYGATVGASESGEIIRQKAPMEWWGFPRIPMLGITQQQGLEKLALFARRYTGEDNLVRQLSCDQLTGIARFRLISRLLWLAHGNLDTLVTDWYQMVLCESVVPIESESLQGMLDSTRSIVEKKIFWLRHAAIARQLYNNFFSSPFVQPATVSQECRGLRTAIGAFISAFWLKYICRQASFALSYFELCRMIRTMRNTDAG